MSFVESDLLEFRNDRTMGGGTLGDIILVANLPYIPEETFDANAADNVKKWEPRPAFVGGGDGLLYYRRMLDQLLQLVSRHKYQDIRQNKGDLDT